MEGRGAVDEQGAARAEDSEPRARNRMADAVQDAAWDGKSRGEGVCAGVAAVGEDQ